MELQQKWGPENNNTSIAFLRCHVLRKNIGLNNAKEIWKKLMAVKQ